MKTDLNTVLALLQKNKAKKMKEGFTTRDLSDAIERSIDSAQRLLRKLVQGGFAEYVGKMEQMNLCGDSYIVPIYKLTPK